MNISERVQEIIKDSEENYLEFSKNGKDKIIKYNQRDIIYNINCYINNKFIELGDDDAIFWNISNSRITHFAKLLSPDTKDFYPYGIGEVNQFQSWILKKKVMDWFDKERFYQTLNDISEGIATYGSQLWKKNEKGGKKKIKEVKLDNIYFDQSIENIEDADGIVEIHYLNKKQLRDKMEVWDNVEEVLDKMENNEAEVWEFSGYIEDEYKKIIGFDYGDNFIKLWEESIEECPYIDFHLGKYRGRWLRVGVVERLFDLQERINTLINQNAQASEIASLLLLKSSNADSVGNVLEQAINGQIINDETLQQIGITNTGLQTFATELQIIEAQADKLCLTPQIVQGEGSPSTTTFRGLAVLNSGAVSAFRDYRQNLLEKIADVLMEYIFPDLVKDWNKEDLIEMTEDDVDIEEFDRAVQKKAELQVLLSGQVITQDVRKQIVDKVEEAISQKGRLVKIPKNFFNFKWGFKMMPTNETVDKASQNDAYFNALQWVLANPNIVNIPLFKQYCEDNNIKSWKLTARQKQQLQEVNQQGGQRLPEPEQPDKLLNQAQPIK